MLEAVKTALQWTSLVVVVLAIVMFMIVGVCALIDFTRKVEDPIGSLADEEKDKENEK